MSENPIEQVISDLLPYFEALEAQSAAILQLMRDKQIATNDELTRYLEQAGDASSVKWRAVRVRMEHLFAVSSDSKARPKSETTEEKEVGKTSDSSEVRVAGAQSEKPRTAMAAEVSDHPRASEKEMRASETTPKPASEKSSNDPAESAPAAEAEKVDLRKIEPSKKSEKDAA
jgi:hypothetical protein